MFSKIVNDEVHWYFGIPRWMIVNNLSLIDKRLNSNSLLVYCYLDRWRNLKYEFQGSVLSILNDISNNYTKKIKKNFPALGNDILNTLSYFEENNFIKVIKGDYRIVDSQFVLEINEDKFIDKINYIALDIKHYDYISNCKSTIKKGNLLLVLVFALHTFICIKEIDTVTGELVEKWYQVFSQSNKKTAKEIGLSEKTIRSALGVLADFETTTNKPLIVRSPTPILTEHNNVVSFPNIYTENTIGWEKRIEKEMIYYERKAHSFEKY